MARLQQRTLIPVLAAAILAAAPTTPPAGAATAPFLIPDTDDLTLGAGPGNAGRVAIGAFDFSGPRYLPPVVWTVGDGRRRITRRALARPTLRGAQTTFVPGGAVVAHARGGAVAVARLDLRGRLVADAIVSDPDPADAAPSAAPLVGPDGTIAQRFKRPPGDGVDPESLTLQPRGAGTWTPPVKLPAGEFGTRVELDPDGGGAAISLPLDGNPSPLLISRFGADGALAPAVPVDLAALRPPGSAGYPNTTAAITDAGTLVVAASVPGVNDDRFRSHLVLVTLPAGAATPTVQEVGIGVDGNGTSGSLDVVATGDDGAAVIAGDGATDLRVFDAAAAATGTWAPSTIAARAPKGGRVFRRSGGGVSVLWSEGGNGFRGGRLMATRRPAGGRFVAPHRLSRNARTQGNLDVLGMVALADDQVLVAYGRYGRGSEGDRTYALIGRP